MKVIVGEKAYVWKFDLTFMEHEFSFLPATFYRRFAERYPIHFSLGPNDSVGFGYVFEDEDALEFLKECDYIYDFLEYQKLSTNDLTKVMNKNLEDFECKKGKIKMPELPAGVVADYVDVTEYTELAKSPTKKKFNFLGFLRKRK